MFPAREIIAGVSLRRRRRSPFSSFVRPLYQETREMPLMMQRMPTYNMFTIFLLLFSFMIVYGTPFPILASPSVLMPGRDAKYTYI